MNYTAFSPKQRTALTWWVPQSEFSRYDALICDGAVRSGKTLAMGLGFFLWAMVSFRDRTAPSQMRASYPRYSLRGAHQVRAVRCLGEKVV